MFHVDNNSAVPVMPAVKPVVSAVTSFFTEGGNGVPPTYPGPDWFNIIQSELLAVLAAAGITPDKASNVQLLAAMRALFLDTSQNGADIQDKALFLKNLGLGDGSGRLINFKVFTASGTYTPIPGTKKIKVTLIGGGGGGGYAGPSFYGSGGGGGGVVKKFMVAPASQSVTVGAGGIAGTVIVEAGSGGNTTFGTLTASGGGGGRFNSNTGGGNGLGGVATGGDVNIQGGTGWGGLNISNILLAGPGGCAPGFGESAGYILSATGGDGLVSTGYGSGGGGGVNGGNGAAGRAGMVIIEEYA
ncbi:MAG: hypothetical protein ACFWT4_21805 [Citrobacter braakii]|jgi:hypothetical protein